MRRLTEEDPGAIPIRPPTFGRFWGLAGRLYNRRILRDQQNVAAIELEGAEHLLAIRSRGAGVMVTPNHPDQADPYVLFEMAARCGGGFAYMAAVQLFRGPARSVLPRIGGFPIDRDGADIRAFKTAVELMARGKPLVVFPEGEVYHLSDRLTPLREGAMAIAVAASKRLSVAGKPTYVLPVAIKYRFLDEQGQLPRLHAALDALEKFSSAESTPGRPLVDRIYDLAELYVSVKERDHFGVPGSGPIPPRIEALREAILARLEDRWIGKRRADPTPVRVKELRRACLDALAADDLDEDAARAIQVDLEELHVALQLFSYPGDYVRECPTIDRASETIRKFEEDLLGEAIPPPRGPRRAIVKIGEPIELCRRQAELGKTRQAIGPITVELQARIQALLDAIGPGNPIAEPLGVRPGLPL